MIRKITMAILLAAAALLQGIVFQVFEVASIKPNLLLIITVSFGLMRGRKSGLLTGFAAGVIYDVLFSDIFGITPLLLMWIGYFSGYLYRIFYDDDIKTPLLFVGIADIVYGTCQYVFLFLIRGRLNFFFYLRRIIIPEMLYTLIITIFIYRLLFALNRVLSKTDKRSIDSLV